MLRKMRKVVLWVLLPILQGREKIKGATKMGFKCPFCKKDFLQDKKKFDLHLKLHNEPVPDLAELAYINSTDTAKKLLLKEVKKCQYRTSSK